MKETKFKAWNKKEKKMYSVNGMSFSRLGVKDVTIQDWSKFGTEEYTLRVNRLVLMQFTGLSDKNGKEIYGGYIVEQKGHGIVGKWHYRGIFRWDNMEAGFRVKWIILEGIYGGHHPEFAEDKFEIIGNIYENPELLKGA